MVLYHQARCKKNEKNTVDHTDIISNTWMTKYRTEKIWESSVRTHLSGMFPEMIPLEYKEC